MGKKLATPATERPRGPKRTLTPDRVLDAAVEILDREGAKALSMRRIGAHLGVAAMAIYNHHQSRDALLDAMAERALGGIALPPPSQDPRARLLAILDGIQQLAANHPQLYAVAITRPTRPAAAAQLMREGLSILRAAGLSEAAALSWYHTALMLLQGYPAWSANQAALPADARTSEPEAGRPKSAADQLRRSLHLLLELLPQQGAKTDR